MAAEDNSNDPEFRLLRFLYVGQEYPCYYRPDIGYRINKPLGYFFVGHVLAIEELAENEEKQLVPIELITKAFESNLVTHPETLVFALAVCCRQKKSEKLRHAAYESVKKICASTPNFILFVKFVSKLYGGEELKNYFTQGWGHGLRKAINNWYLSKKPLDFIECVTKYRSRYGWKHKDIVKMAHPVGNSPENKVILKYIIHGLEKTKKDVTVDEIEKTPNIHRLLKYMEEVEDFKHCEDEVRAATLLETYGFSLDHVPEHLLKSKEVWNSLLMSMDVDALLNNLLRIHNLGFLAADEPIVEKVTERLTDSHYIEATKVHPALVFITLKNYQCSRKSMNYEKRKRELAKKFTPKFDPNVKVIDALNEAFFLSFRNIQSTNLRYLVTISINESMEAHTWHNGNMTGIETAALIALILLRSEENVTIATFKNIGIYEANVQKPDSFDDILKTLKAMPIDSINTSEPISWAKRHSKQYDVFINIIEMFRNDDEFQENLISYKEHMKLPNTKLITCALCSDSPPCHNGHFIENYDRHVLTINGFDATVPNVIQAFVKGLF